ncbi:AAA-ATPase At3g28580-like [Phoenix dactylifera]|uniref:AAA-ATPase At3g28580-like n=1 Tax=Phoenix dactylifera TaxID=42345 RepID=A0A8B9AVE8_PHODC|nr:AAA-ATPase At3g28580-like [Phoenix dactylifera]
MREQWANLGSAIASLMFLGAVLSKFFPFGPEIIITKYLHKLASFIYPYVQIKIPEYTGERMKRSEAFTAIEAYLSASCSQRANKLKGDLGKDSSKLVLSMDDHEEVTDEFGGAKFWWSSTKSTRQAQTLSIYPAPEETRSYHFTFHKRNRQLVLDSYLSHVLKEGREVAVRNRRRKLYCNNPSSNWHGYKSSVWSHVLFEHPSSFDTLAMDPGKKLEIKKDLDAFRKGKDYYAKIGKAWKRGYLLYGPPGTGKSSMIVAMANFLDYDVYDLELTTVKNNVELRKLFIETTGKSIIVIEDIDCSLDLTGKRKQKGKKEEGASEDKKNLPPGQEEKDESSKVTLSGLLNFIDGIWSACGGERLIVFTTNHIEKLDPALIRRGRMDKHIEMSYCCFGAFKVLAKNYLDVDSHPMFDTIRDLMEEVKITPADVAENLMRKSGDEDADSCLKNLIQAMNKAREEEASKQAQASTEEIVEGEEEKSGAKEEEASKQARASTEEIVEGEEEKSGAKEEEASKQAQASREEIVEGEEVSAAKEEGASKQAVRTGEMNGEDESGSRADGV